MDFKSTLKNGCFALELKGNTKEEVITEMVDLLSTSGKISDHDTALRSVLEREKKMSTGMQCGVAIPHGKIEGIDDIAVVFALKKEGIDFGALDGQPSRIFVMTISSLTRTGPHIQYLAEISKILNIPSVRERLLAAATPDEVVQILTTGVHSSAPVHC